MTPKLIFILANKLPVSAKLEMSFFAIPLPLSEGLFTQGHGGSCIPIFLQGESRIQTNIHDIVFAYQQMA